MGGRMGGRMGRSHGEVTRGGRMQCGTLSGSGPRSAGGVSLPSSSRIAPCSGSCRTAILGRVVCHIREGRAGLAHACARVRKAHGEEQGTDGEVGRYRNTVRRGVPRAAGRGRSRATRGPFFGGV
eukprot:5092958-Prymnesium_polylepis.1